MSTASDVVANTLSSITAAQSGVTTAMTNLNNVLSGFSFSSYSPVDAPADVVFTSFPDADATIKTALALFDTEVAAVDFPAMPSLGSLPSGAAAAWSAADWGSLKSLLTAFTSDITGADDVDTVVTKLSSETTQMQVALYAAEVGRKQQALRDVNSAIDAAVGGRGFTYPNSMSTAMKMDAIQKYQLDLSQASRDLVKLIFEWAKSNYQFSLGKQIEAHASDVDFNIRYAGVLVAAYAEEVRALVSQYREEMAGILEKAALAIKAYNARVEVAKLNIEALSADDRHNLAVYAAATQEAIAGFKMITDQVVTVKTQQITAAAQAVSAAASMANAANQVAVGVLNG